MEIRVIASRSSLDQLERRERCPWHIPPKRRDGFQLATRCGLHGVVTAALGVALGIYWKTAWQRINKRLRLRLAVRKLLCILYRILCSRVLSLRISACLHSLESGSSFWRYERVLHRLPKIFYKVQINCKLGMLKVCFYYKQVTFFPSRGCTSQLDEYILPLIE